MRLSHKKSLALYKALVLAYLIFGLINPELFRGGDKNKRARNEIYWILAELEQKLVI
jgi:hypothetical protein